MDGLEDVRTYISDLLVLRRSAFDKHLLMLNAVFKCLDNAGLKVNAKKYKFFASEIKYLSF